MALTITTRNAMLDALTITHASLHVNDPGTTGINEVSGGTYARQSVTFAAASNGSRAMSNQPVFDVPAGTTVAWVGLWDSATFLGSVDATDEVYANAGTYTITSASISVS